MTTRTESAEALLNRYLSWAQIASEPITAIINDTMAHFSNHGLVQDQELIDNVNNLVLQVQTAATVQENTANLLATLVTRIEALEEALSEPEPEPEP